jgi:uncharacterized protein (DUF362 family)
VEGKVMERREFLQVAAGAGAVLATGRAWAFSRPAASHFALHPFIESHPEAVFVLRTNVIDRKDAAAKQSIGKTLARQLFTLQDAPGIPLSSKIAIKPNLTHNNNSGDTYAIITDREFLGGMIDGMKQTGFSAGRTYVRDGMGTNQTDTKYQDMAAGAGVHYDDSADRQTAFKDCPGGVVFKRIGYLGPFMYPDAYLINVAKFKTHAMGLTLCVKNLQGLTVPPYLQFCQGLRCEIAGDFQPDAQKHCDALYQQHKKAGIPRWDDAKAAAMEMWVHHALDNFAVVKPAVGLHVIEGISGQNGNAFTAGPGPGGTAEVFLTNLVLFGKDPFRLDILGHWLGGHEPGNFGLFHLAKERRLSTALDPRNIPIYLWENSGPKLTPFADLEKFRTPLTTPYLPKPGEPQYHLCNEPFSYPSEPAAVSLKGGERPVLRVLGHMRAVHSESTAILEYAAPSPVDAALDVYDAAGQCVRRLAAGPVERGLHMASFDTRGVAAGQYVCNLRMAGHSCAVPIQVVR